ncbi:methylenetetrahydrofolate reductase C-terminal domain-containing protein [Geosporobacter ferrireducens]|uniref:5,10-methylenetetrahydrofolate reductase n=1 Tax=Geosporobacter ferrireducens TaxID=1424294 RepID=A0A1D8GE77_9FIRM|nr:methylenetetrahydrofolate reductase C-terminal domain-containing protein [Geosporobacter ferrireducens]AOT69217.1 5,10-methylenetetrahydrofolate reductase [Geosporobacter ferrireducens]MTI56897.1 5,10-methylenetetrahydrofolate reductase [Geosporobacter ferrireducens]
MIISQKKSQEELLSFLKGSQKIAITGCSLCASTCKVGGEEEILELKAWLEEEGKEVTGYKVLDPACNLLKTTKDLKKMKEELKDADAILSVACGDGTQTVAKAVKLPVYPGVDTMFIGEIERVGQYEESCRACGECELGWTGSICPITRCAKGLVNGPCGGAKDKKCEVNKENECAWIMIYEKMKELGQLDKLMEVREPKNYQKSNNPRKINLREANKEAVEA